MFLYCAQIYKEQYNISQKSRKIINRGKLADEENLITA